MTYGIDQCRVCGVAIMPDRNTLEEYQAALKRPTMPEAQWRRLGFLAVPTKRQLTHPENGCCALCGQKMIRRKWKPWRRNLLWIGTFVGFLCFLTFVFTFARH